jgi:hypothetical protein
MVLPLRISRVAVVALLLLCTITPALAGMITSSPNMPPHGGVYAGTGTVMYPMGVFLRNITLSHFDASYPPPLPGFTNVHMLGARLDCSLSLDAGVSWIDVWAPVSETLKTTGTLVPGSYSDELLGLEASGGALPSYVRMRESPIQASTGSTTIEAVGDNYNIDSFFDVWFEVSLDDGMTWYPADGSTNIELTPEPSSFLALFAGLLGLAGMRRRKA